MMISCGKDDNPDDNEYKDPWTLVQEVYIGSSGGVIDTSGIRFEIPAGVFEGSRKISLYISEDNALGSNQASKVYEIRGLPEEFEGVLPVSIKPAGPVEDDFYLAVGTYQYAYSLNDTVYALTYLPATDSNGYINSQIKVVKPGGNQRGGSDDPEFEGIMQGDVLVLIPAHQGWYQSSKDHFKVTFSKPDATLADATALGEALETALQKFSDLGFDKISKLDSKYPIPVKLRTFKSTFFGLLGDNVDIYGVYTTSGWYLSPELDFNMTWVKDPKIMNVTAGHECFHMIQSLYTNAGKKMYNWWTEATAVYTEDFFTSQPYSPRDVNSHVFRALLGMQAGAEWKDPVHGKNTSFHGYGMAPIVKYVCNHATFPDKALLSMTQMLETGMHPVEIVLSQTLINSPVTAWEDAMLAYIKQEIYPVGRQAFTSGSLFTETNHARAVNLEPGLPAPPVVSYSIPDLSATVTTITPKGNFTDDQELDVKVISSENMSYIKTHIFYFDSKTQSTPLITEPQGGTSLKSLLSKNYNILFYLTNSKMSQPNYSGMTNITLELRIKGKPVVKTNSATGISSTSATVNGEVNPSGYATEVIFEYGLTSSYGNLKSVFQPGLDGFLPVQLSASLDGLEPNKTYHYRISATNEKGTSVGLDQTFKTSANSSQPVAVTLAATNVGGCKATLNGTINPIGATAWGEFEYGLTTAYGNTVTLNTEYTGDQPIAVSRDLTKSFLTPNQTYHYRLNAYRQGFTDVSYGADMTFTLSGAIEVGQLYQGGIVFYVDETCTHGLIAAPEDLGLTDWGCSGLYIGATANGTNAGISNTAAIVAGCTTENIAAALCNDITLGGYTDWYLPSSSELTVLINSKDMVGGFNSGPIYWSSTEIDANQAYGVSLDEPMNWVPVAKNSMHAVRPIRAF